MNGNWMRLFTTVVGGCVLLSVLSCGRDQELVSIQVQPSTETFGSSNTLPFAGCGTDSAIAGARVLYPSSRYQGHYKPSHLGLERYADDDRGFRRASDGGWLHVRKHTRIRHGEDQ